MKGPILLVIAPLLAARIAAANDAVFGGDGADLAPIQETRVRMASEHIELDRRAVDRRMENGRTARQQVWEVVASYVFENPTDRPITLTLGFPEDRLDDDESPPFGDRHAFRDLRITVAGQDVPHRIGTVRRAPRWAPWAGKLGRVHLFSVTFRPGPTPIVHRYVMAVSYSNMTTSWLTYVTRTGALWNGPIGRARFTFRVPERPWSLVWPRSFATPTMRTLADGRTEVAFEQTDWRPTQDLFVHFGGPGRPLFPPCPSASRDDAPWEFFRLPPADRRVCANLPYAHHGYAFKDPQLRARFYQKPVPIRYPDYPSPPDPDGALMFQRFFVAPDFGLS